MSARVAEAAQRQRDRGGFANTFYYRAIHKVCDRIGITRFGPGQMRHTVATRAVEAGADPVAVAAFLCHKSASTTLRFYATLASVPPPPGPRLLDDAEGLWQGTPAVLGRGSPLREAVTNRAAGIPVKGEKKRHHPDSNWGWQICSLLPYHLAMVPCPTERLPNDCSALPSNARPCALP